MRIKKSYFTLLELLVVIIILASVAVVTGLKLAGAYAEQRFLSETEQVLNHLQMAQDLMILLDSDVTLKMGKKKEGFYECWLDVEKPLIVRSKKEGAGKEEIDKQASIAWSRLVQRRIPLHAIQSVQFEEWIPKSSIIEEDSETHERLLCLPFSLGRMPTGKLILAAEKETKQREIVLVGFPCSIKDQLKVKKEAEEFKDERKRIEESETLYPRLEE